MGRGAAWCAVWRPENRYCQDGPIYQSRGNLVLCGYVDGDLYRGGSERDDAVYLVKGNDFVSEARVAQGWKAVGVKTTNNGIAPVPRWRGVSLVIHIDRGVALA